MPSPAYRRLNQITTSERIKQLADKAGVTIILDIGYSDSLLSKIESTYLYDNKDKILTILVPKLEIEDKELLFDIIKKVNADGDIIWKNPKKDALNSYKEYFTNNNNQETLSFFSEILTTEDFDALKMSLYLRDQSKKGKSIHSYKIDIRNKFGDRGANIANLCSAGYFEEFMEIYNTSVEDFNRYYEMTVSAKARALFVHASMTVDTIEQEVFIMVEKALKYHMDDFRVHGKGVSNVAKIEQFIGTRKKEQDGYSVKKVFEDEKMNVVEYLVEIIRE